DAGDGGLPGTSAELVRRELLDPYGVDLALLTADDGISVSLMASPHRAAELARAHNDWMAARWLDADPRFRGTIIVPAQDPLASACSIMAHLVSLVCHGTFERVPGLRVLLLEGGLAWLPGILWRLDTNWRGLKAEAPWLERRPSEVIREHIAFTTQPLEHTDGHDDLLFEMLAAAGAPEILCFASDYPHWDFDDPARMLQRLPEHWRETVMTTTAERLFGARPAAGAPWGGRAPRG